MLCAYMPCKPKIDFVGRTTTFLIFRIHTRSPNIKTVALTSQACFCPCHIWDHHMWHCHMSLSHMTMSHVTLSHVKLSHVIVTYDIVTCDIVTCNCQIWYCHMWHYHIWHCYIVTLSHVIFTSDIITCEILSQYFVFFRQMKVRPYSDSPAWEWCGNF